MKSGIVLIQKNPAKGNIVGNYCPIACVNLLRKLKTGIIADKLYQHLENENLLLAERKGGRHFFRSTKLELLIDTVVFMNFKRKETIVNRAWLDFRKSYDMVRHSWIMETLILIGAALNVIVQVKSFTR